MGRPISPAPSYRPVSPIVSVVSSGDESARKEYIHPRATLMGALGKWSRVPEPLIFVTELVAFFEDEGVSRLQDEKKAKKRGSVLRIQPHRLWPGENTHRRQTPVRLYG
jgi:hypothetical protein